MTDQQLVSSKTFFTAKLFTVSEDVLQAKGKEFTFSSVRTHATVLVIPITPKGEIFLIRQYRYMLKDTVLGAIAGYIDEGETSLQAAKRELKEEAGIEAAQLELIAKAIVMRSVVHHQIYIFLAKGLEFSAQNLQDEEEIELIQMPLVEAVEKVMNGEIYHSPSMTGILMLAELKRRKQL